jgi:glycosyltransferase involved in cell wall biosynthesis
MNGVNNRIKNNNRIQRERELKDRMRKKLAIKQGAKKICLTMIVKNESKNMVRLLDSVKDIIDMISIVDTGSTDNTEDIIINWGKKNNIPTTVHHEKFKNFAHNRTHSVRVAKDTYPEADYFLLSDADFVWNVNVGNKFDKILLIDHKYLIEQYNKALSYWNIRLLSSKIDWICEGVTHEYWCEAKNQKEYSGEVRTAKIRTLLIDDREDGGCKSDKFERDEKLLREGLEDKDTPKISNRDINFI